MSVLKTKDGDVVVKGPIKLTQPNGNILEVGTGVDKTVISNGWTSGTGDWLRFEVPSADDEGGLLQLNSNGNVGIGTESPTEKLDVVGTVKATSFVGDGIIPTGTILTFAGNGVIPAGFVACDGASLSRTAYSDLFAVLSGLYGSTSTTFNVPDLRDEFLRGWGSGRAIGSTQGHDWKGFTLYGTGNNSYSHTSYMGKTTESYSGNWFAGHWNTTANRMTLKWDGSEIRPRNIAMIFIIKY